jgi:hypothetical protein
LNQLPNWWLHYHPGDATNQDIETLLQHYGAVLDYPAAMYGPELYSTYPDAKYILVRFTLFDTAKWYSLDEQTTRDPEKWEISMKATILQNVLSYREALQAHTITPEDTIFLNWCETYMLSMHSPKTRSMI